jgi:hypothetical protein
MAKVSLKERKEKLGLILAGFVEAGVLTEAQSAEISGVFGSQAVSTKVNEEGLVFCNYFGKYMPAEAFHTSTKGKIDSMSIEGKKLHRTQKSMVNKANNEVLKQYRAGEITAEEMDTLLKAIEKNAGHKFPEGTAAINADYPFEV